MAQNVCLLLCIVSAKKSSVILSYLVILCYSVYHVFFSSGSLNNFIFHFQQFEDDMSKFVCVSHNF